MNTYYIWYSFRCDGRYIVKLDTPEPSDLFFQEDIATQIGELHNNIMYYLFITLFAVSWIIFTSIMQYKHKKRLKFHEWREMQDRRKNRPTFLELIISITPKILIILYICSKQIGDLIMDVLTNEAVINTWTIFAIITGVMVIVVTFPFKILFFVLIEGEVPVTEFIIEEDSWISQYFDDTDNEVLVMFSNNAPNNPMPSGGNFPGGNFPGGNFPGGNFPGGNFPGGNFPGGNNPGGNNPGGNFPGSNLPGGNIVIPDIVLSAPNYADDYKIDTKYWYLKLDYNHHVYGTVSQHPFKDIDPQLFTVGNRVTFQARPGRFTSFSPVKTLPTDVGVLQRAIDTQSTELQGRISNHNYTNTKYHYNKTTEYRRVHNLPGWGEDNTLAALERDWERYDYTGFNIIKKTRELRIHESLYRHFNPEYRSRVSKQFFEVD